MSEPTCGCIRCLRERREGTTFDDGLFLPAERTRMVGCALCGNKRCPHATDHRLKCTESNVPGQDGSIFGSPNRDLPPLPTISGVQSSPRSVQEGK